MDYRKLIAEHMLASRRTSPHVTTVFEADMSAAGQPMTMTGSVDATSQTDPKMMLKMTLGGQAMDFIIVDKSAYMQLPGVSGGKYIKMSLEEMYAAGGGTGDSRRARCSPARRRPPG